MAEDTKTEMLEELRQCHVELEEAGKILAQFAPRTAMIFSAAADRVAAVICKSETPPAARPSADQAEGVGPLFVNAPVTIPEALQEDNLWKLLASGSASPEDQRYAAGWIAALARRDADIAKAVEVALLEAANIARQACLVPPDGGSPSPDETRVSDQAAEGILLHLAALRASSATQADGGGK